jgi:cytochrome c oxidase assembly protein subunit 15
MDDRAGGVLQTAQLNMPMTGVSEPQPQGVWLHRYATLAAFCTLVLIAAGALVTSNDAGLSIPDWPLSYGKLVPPLIGGIRYEWTHRLIAGTVGMLTLGLAAWLIVADSRRWMRRLGVAAVGLIVAQATLGGMTVLFFQPWWVSTAHACLAQAFFCVMVSLAVFTTPSWGPAAGIRFIGARTSEKLAMTVVVAVFLQLLVGAGYRHKGLGMTWHLAGAVIVTVAVFWTVVRALRHDQHEAGVAPAAITLGSLLLGQLFLGGGSLGAKLYYSDAPQPMPIFVYVTTIHVALGALTLASAVVLALLLFRANSRASFQTAEAQ